MDQISISWVRQGHQNIERHLQLLWLWLVHVRLTTWHTLSLTCFKLAPFTSFRYSSLSSLHHFSFFNLPIYSLPVTISFPSSWVPTSKAWVFMLLSLKERLSVHWATTDLDRMASNQSQLGGVLNSSLVRQQQSLPLPVNLLFLYS